MPESIKTILSNAGVLKHVVLSAEIDVLLGGLTIKSGPTDLGGGISVGTVEPDPNLSKSPIPGFDFALSAPPLLKPAPFKLKLEPTAFQCWLQLADQEQALFIFKFVKGVPGMALTGATPKVAPDGTVTLEALPDGDPRHAPYLVSRSVEPGAALGPALLIAGSAAEPAAMRFTPDTDSTKGVVTLGLEPRTVVFGSSKIGFDCPAVTIDDSEDAKGPGDGAPALDPPLAAISADAPAWRGILARELDFYLPADVPLFGGHPIKGYFAIPTGQGGVELVVETKVPSSPETPEHPKRLGYSIRIECIDPTAVGLSGLVPTLISASMELPLDGAKSGFADGGANRDITFAAGKPVRATATFARDPVNAPDQFKITIGVAAQGQEGLVSVTSNGMGGAKIFNTAAALATALIADKDVERKADVGDTKGVVLYGLLAAGTALSSLFTDDSHFVLHGAEIESSGHGAPVGGPIVLTLDYSVAVRVTEVDIGVLSVSMSPNQPMRIRVRKARMSVDPGKSGLSMIGLDFDHAEMEIENPGAWNVHGLEQLFDVLRSRSGRGSSWMEVDLGFKLNLGPIKVQGATIRATLNNDGSIDATIRGLEAGLSIPGAIEATGGLQLVDGGFAASLLAQLLPLGVNADAGVVYEPPMLVLRLDIDLPAPIPLANSGFGLFGMGGLLGFSAVPDYSSVPEQDPVIQQLKWTPKEPSSFKPAPSQSSFGLFAAVGTLPDLGFSFSAKAGVLISVPDIAVRGSLNGKVMQPVTKLADPSYPPSPGISFLGFVAIDADALSFGLLGSINLKPLLEINVPIAGHFPFANASDWYTYLGADGAPVQGRSIGPISAKVLPGILDVGADAYLMLRGSGIDGWPFGRALPSGALTITDGFVLAFGFGLQNTFGIKPIVWAELYASLDMLIGAKPPTLAGFGRAGGSLNLGPFSLGVEAQVAFMVREAQSYFWAEVTGRIELFFFDIEGTVTISFGDLPKLTLPPPDMHPLDLFDKAGNRVGSLGTLTDDTYRVVAPLVEDPGLITDAMQVWPDAMVSLPFVIPPEVVAGSIGQFKGADGPGANKAAVKTGSEMLYYTWLLKQLTLVDVTDEADKFQGAGAPPPGQLPARWQVPRGGDKASDVSELLLFSTGPDLWVNRLSDGGAGIEGNPLQQAADICQRSVSPRIGWAVGFLAGRDAQGFRLPPDPVSTNPLDSRVEAHMHHFGLPREGTPVALDRAYALPEPFSLDPAELVAWPQPREIKRPFQGHIVAPNLHWLDGGNIRDLLGGGAAFAGQQVRLDLTEAILDGLLVLIADRDLFGIREDFFGLRIFDDLGHEWHDPELTDAPDGETIAIFKAPTADAVRQLIVNFPIARRLGIVGVGGITVRARDRAASENNSIADEIARLTAAAAAGPKIDYPVNTPHQRAILSPGRTYRIDLEMQWSGEISKQNEAGQVVSVAKTSYGDPGTDSYLPKGGDAGRPAKRQLFFKTAPKPVDRQPVQYGHLLYSNWLNAKQDVFQPEMLQRYLAGYDPAQSEAFRFCDDPIRAHFLQDHVAALATAYGFDLQVAVRRVDRPGAQYASPLLLDPLWSFGTDPLFLGATDQLRYGFAKASPCSVPTPGATATVSTALEPEAWYEAYVLAKSDEPAFADGKLPGVTFRTSRWRTAKGMFTGLGLTVAGEPDAAEVVTGDLAVAAPGALGAAVIDGDDQAFDNALAQLGLEGWPVSDQPRLSRLWVQGGPGQWLFAGLMMESPEPINRPGRIELAGLGLEMGKAGAAVTFDIRRRDRSGSRLIYLTAAPFQVITRERVIGPLGGGGGLGGDLGNGGLGNVGLGNGGIGKGGGARLPRFRPVTPTLVLKAKDMLGAPADIAGTLVIPAAPGFAEDP